MNWAWKSSLRCTKALAAGGTRLTAPPSALSRYPELHTSDGGFYDAVNPVTGAIGHRRLVLDQSMIMGALDDILNEGCASDSRPIAAPRALAPAGPGRTTVRCDLTNGAASNDRSASVRRLVALAYILAISIPPLGLILGITLSLRSGRQYAKHGMGIIGLSIIASIVWVVLLTSGALTTPTTGY
jgi:hypothetical protein